MENVLGVKISYTAALQSMQPRACNNSGLIEKNLQAG